MKPGFDSSRPYALVRRSGGDSSGISGWVLASSTRKCIFFPSRQVGSGSNLKTFPIVDKKKKMDPESHGLFSSGLLEVQLFRSASQIRSCARGNRPLIVEEFLGFM